LLSSPITWDCDDAILRVAICLILCHCLCVLQYHCHDLLRLEQLFPDLDIDGSSIWILFDVVQEVFVVESVDGRGVVEWLTEETLDLVDRLFGEPDQRVLGFDAELTLLLAEEHSGWGLALGVVVLHNE
jgi:hypothetical protein